MNLAPNRSDDSPMQAVAIARLNRPAPPAHEAPRRVGLPATPAKADAPPRRRSAVREGQQ